MEPLSVPLPPVGSGKTLLLPADELSVSFARSGGPGGQNVNKVETKVVLRWNPRTSRVLGEEQRELLLTRLASRLTGEGELVLHASRYRERARNLEDARERLADIVAAALVVQRTRRATRPTRGSQRRRLDAKSRRSDVKKNRRRPEE